MIENHLDESKKKWRIVFGLLAVSVILSFILSISLGSVNIPFRFIFSFFIGESDNQVWANIIQNFRIPKAITSLLAGSALAISGLQMQTLFRNPLAGPFILGISSGAGLGVALVIFLGVWLGGFLEMTGMGRSWLLVGASGLGSFVVLSVVLVASFRIRSGVSLLIIGLMFGSAVSALVSILQYFSQAENIQAYVIWTFGSLGSLSWSELNVMLPVILISLATSFLLSKPLNALLLGENYAESLGLNLKKARMLIIINTSLLAGTITAFCGPIAFIGLAVPHIARMLFNTGNHLLLTPLVIFLGGTLLLVFDIIAQLPGMDETLPINAVTSLFGAPFVIWLIVRKSNLNYRF
ncbi:iron complex transport system permease protein [Ekhidna lutea]|uniref:Iron complex transport system permease protein n=1 Tax=Ekhidna lutea TaxID=447679 RepID=A0A239KC83_EKHLU|nr:iron ABC transporter permease [Ekhidna lutea]SNT16006.1 iron complex transport system permease protein [Ekhidna lutea]